MYPLRSCPVLSGPFVSWVTIWVGRKTLKYYVIISVHKRKKFLISYEIRNFFRLWGYIIMYCTCAFCVTQTLTQKRKGADSIVRASPVAFMSYMARLMTFPMASAASRFISAVAWV